MDKVSKEKRSEIMRKVRSKNTAPELKIRSLLHALGYRFRLHRKDLPGRPDIILPKYKTVIFVHGCFWHGHKDCKKSKLPLTKTEQWKRKILTNMERDTRNIADLEKLGWNVIVIWTCELAKPDLAMSKLNIGLKRNEILPD